MEETKTNIHNFDRKKRIDIDKPRWDESTFIGRFRHFCTVTNPGNLLYSDAELYYAKDIVQRYRSL
jgi:hypothetical protein